MPATYIYISHSSYGLSRRLSAQIIVKMPSYSFKCKDIGMKYGFEVGGGASSKDELMQIASIHAKVAHGIQSVSPDLA